MIDMIFYVHDHTVLVDAHCGDYIFLLLLGYFS